MLRTLLTVSLCLSCLWMAACTKRPSLADDLTENELETDALQAKNLNTDLNGLSQLSATFKTVHGNFTMRFYPQQAPHTVTRIIQLINGGFYDGLRFQKVVPHFVVQTGPPQDGRPGSGQRLMAEFNDLRHVRGAVAMARPGNDPDGADNQFYIVFDTMPHLDHKFTIFAQVTDGIEVTEQIVQDDKILSAVLNFPQNPTRPPR